MTKKATNETGTKEALKPDFSEETAPNNVHAFNLANTPIATIFKGIFQSNNESMNNVYDSYGNVQRELDAMSRSDELSFEQKQYIVDKNMEAADKQNKKDSENKKFYIYMAGIIAGTVITCAWIKYHSA